MTINDQKREKNIIFLIFLFHWGIFEKEEIQGRSNSAILYDPIYNLQ